MTKMQQRDAALKFAQETGATLISWLHPVNNTQGIPHIAGQNNAPICGAKVTNGYQTIENLTHFTGMVCLKCAAKAAAGDSTGDTTMSQTLRKALREVNTIETTGHASGRYLPSETACRELVTLGYMRDAWEFKLTEAGKAWIAAHPVKTAK